MPTVEARRSRFVPDLALPSPPPSAATAASRRHVHTRTIRVDAYARSDGLWDIEAELVDTKGGDFQLATGVRKANKGGTDHLAFIPYGVPGFNFDQETRGYNHTHHSQVDTYDHAVPGDLMQASAIVASFAYHAATRPELLPRKPLPKPQPAGGPR